MTANVAWPSQRLQNLDKSLRRLARLVETAAPEQLDEVTQALARFLVVRACGHLEKVVQESLLAYVDGKSSHKVRAFSRSWLTKVNNPSPDKLTELVARFDPTLARDLDDAFSFNDHELRREIALLVQKRNLIAHGEAEGIGSRKALDLLSYEKVLSDWFVLNFDPR